MGTLVAGGMVGAGVALLFAPQSGKRTRRDLHYLGRKALNQSEAIGMELRQSLDNLMDDVTEGVHESMQRSFHWADQARRDLKSALASGQSRLEAGIGKIRQAS